MNTTTTTEAAAAVRSMQVQVADLRAGDLVMTTGAVRERLEVARVTKSGPAQFVRVEFCGGGQTRPLLPRMLVTVERASEGGAA